MFCALTISSEIMWHHCQRESMAFYFVGLELKTMCKVNCEFCEKPMKFEYFSARERCDGKQCSDYLLQAAA